MDLTQSKMSFTVLAGGEPQPVFMFRTDQLWLACEVVKQCPDARLSQHAQDWLYRAIKHVPPPGYRWAVSMSCTLASEQLTEMILQEDPEFSQERSEAFQQMLERRSAIHEGVPHISLAVSLEEDTSPASPISLAQLDAELVKEVKRKLAEDEAALVRDADAQWSLTLRQFREAAVAGETAGWKGALGRLLRDSMQLEVHPAGVRVVLPEEVWSRVMSLGRLGLLADPDKYEYLTFNGLQITSNASHRVLCNTAPALGTYQRQADELSKLRERRDRFGLLDTTPKTEGGAAC